MKFLSFSQTKLGSSLSLPAHGWVGARATLLFPAAHFAKQNTNSVSVQSEGEAEGGCGGNSASPEPKRSPAALLVQSRSQQKSFLYLLEEKRGGARKSKIEKKTFLLAGERQRAAAGRSVSSVQNRFGFGRINAPKKARGNVALFLFASQTLPNFIPCLSFNSRDINKLSYLAKSLRLEPKKSDHFL